MRLAAKVSKTNGARQQAAGGILRFRAVTADNVKFQLDLSSHHRTQGGALRGAALAEAAEAAVDRAMSEFPAEGGAFSHAGMHSACFSDDAGSAIRGETLRVHHSPSQVVWRTRFVSESGDAIAEITETRVRAVPAGPDANMKHVARGQCAADHEPEIQPAERLDKILEAAIRLGARQGLANTSIREIAVAAGMPVPTMYHYIRSKEDLLKLIHRTMMSDISAMVRDEVGAGGSATAKLERAIRRFMTNNDRYHRQIKLMFRESAMLSPAVRQEIFAFDRRYLEVWQSILDAGQASGEFQIKRPHVIADFIVFLTAIWALRHWSIGDEGLENVTDAMCEFVLNAVSARPRPGRRKLKRIGTARGEMRSV